LLAGEAIDENAFRAFCEALELNPYEIAENLEPPSKLRQFQLQIALKACIELLKNNDFILAEQEHIQEFIDILRRRIDIEKNELIQIPLPEKFKVYVKGESLISHPKVGYEDKVLPTVNIFRGQKGGYVGCYSHNQELSVCSFGGIHLIGQIRLKGEYCGRIFVPKRCDEGKDISSVQWIKDLCNQHFPSAKGDVWAGGDTGGWFEFPTSMGKKIVLSCLPY
jgi:hypothetical protein